MNYIKWNQFTEIDMWHQRTTFYGKLFLIAKKWLHKLNLFFATVIPGFYPLPLAVAINRFFIKKDIKFRYGSDEQ